MSVLHNNMLVVQTPQKVYNRDIEGGFTMSKRKLIALILFLIIIGLAVAAYTLLPDKLVVQIGLNGEASNTLPKLIGLLIPFGLGIVGTISYLHGNPDYQKKGLLFALLGIAFFILTFFINYNR